jgi:hypothetical protein
MKPDPASNPLVVRRPGDELTEPEIMAAWKAIKQNPSAMAAAQAELQHDEQLRALLREAIVTPPDLLERLQATPLLPLASQTPGNVTPLSRRNFSRWLGAAAAVGVAAYFWQRHNTGPKIMWDHLKSQVVRWASAPQLALQSEQLTALQSHLQKLGALIPSDIPGPLSGQPTIGCQVLKVDSGEVSIICFTRNGFAFHLFATNQDFLAGGSSYFNQGKPRFWEHQGWNHASWGKEPQALMILTQAPTEELQALFA